MKAGVTYKQTTAGTMSASLSYELDSDRYPTLGNEFFTRLRQKYPRAFQRSVPHSASQSSVRSSASSDDSKPVWSQWECNGDESKATVKEAGGILIPHSDISVDERLKRISDSFSSVKTTGDDLLVALRTFRQHMLLSAVEFVIPGAGGHVQGCSTSADSSRQDVVDPLNSASVLRKSSSETKSSNNDVVLHSEPLDTSCNQPADCGLQSSTVDAVAGTVATVTGDIAEQDILQAKSVDDIDCNPAVDITVLLKDQLNNGDEFNLGSSNIAFPEDPSQRCDENERSSTVDSVIEMPENGPAAVTESGARVNNIQPVYRCIDQRKPVTASESQKSVSGHSVITDQKPPLVKRGKIQRQSNVRSSFTESAAIPKNSSSNNSFVFSNTMPEAPGSAEPIRRKLRLPWKKKKRYLPGEESSRWTTNFESWRSSSQLSLDINSESDNDTGRCLRRSASYTDVQNADNVSVGWTDSDTDTASDDPLAASLDGRERKLQAMSSYSVDSSTDAKQSRGVVDSYLSLSETDSLQSDIKDSKPVTSCGWRSSLRSSAHKRFSSLQKSAGRRLLRLQKAMNIGQGVQNSMTNDSIQSEQTTNVDELSRQRHSSGLSNASSLRSDIESPRHFRPIGRILSHDVTDGTTVVELVRPPHGPYGIYFARDGDDPRNTLYISRLSDGLPVHFYAGLLAVGDEVLAINDTAVSGLSLDAVFDMIALSPKLLLRLRRAAVIEM